MSEPYQIFVLIPSGVAPDRAVASVHDVLTAHGGSLDTDSTLYLNDDADQEYEPEPIIEADDALRRLGSHPTLGSIDYAMPESMANVTFQGSERGVEFIGISILSKAFEAGGEATLRRYEDVARQLHERLGAIRTIMDWGLEYRGVRWSEELNRLRQKQYAGTFDLLDLRRE